MQEETIDIIQLDANLSDVEKVPALPANTYTGEVQDVQIQTSGAGNKYFAVKFIVPPEEIPANVREHYEDGAVLYWNRQVVPNGKDRRALYNLRKMLEALGLNTNVTSVDPSEWMGQKARLNVQIGTWNNEERAEIKSLAPAEVKAAPKKRR